MRRGVLWGGVVAVALAGLTACTADDINAIGLTSGGDPVAENCGSWITGVSFSDAETGRLVWSASATTPGDDDHSVDRVEVGALPAGWREDSSLAIEPRPESWRIAIDREGDGPEEIVVGDDELAAGHVVLRDGHIETEQRFIDDRCGYAAPLGDSGWLLLLIVPMVGIPPLAWRIDRRRRTRPLPAGRR